MAKKRTTKSNVVDITLILQMRSFTDERIANLAWFIDFEESMGNTIDSDWCKAVLSEHARRILLQEAVQVNGYKIANTSEGAQILSFRRT